MMSPLLVTLVFRIHLENKEIFDRLVMEHEEFLLMLQDQTPVDLKKKKRHSGLPKLKKQHHPE